MTTETAAEKFWRESHEKRERREEIEALPMGVLRLDAILRDIWTSDNLAAMLRDEPLRFGLQDLDEWLAEDNPYRMTHYGVPGVLEALGLR